MRVAKVGDLAEQLRGVTFAKADASSAPREGHVPILRAGNIRDGRLHLSDLVYVPSTKVREVQRLQPNDVVIAASSGSKAVVGKAARSCGEFDGGFGAFLKVLRPGKGVDPGYFAHYFQTPTYRRRVSALAAGANINNLKTEHLDDLEIGLPPLDEQRRIATILDHADTLRTKRRQTLAHLDTLTQSIFHAMFGDPAVVRTELLADIAEVSSGITKGRRVSGPTRSVPYLAVSNVQAGYLDMSVVKQIEATEAEIERYSLAEGDLLLTEGGDPDKLGRGTVWRSELPSCIHQNHIFRVRTSSNGLVSPDYLSVYMASPRSRSYFLRSAKQTTGIASINMTQLRALPVGIPPLDLQQEFADRVKAARVVVGLASPDPLDELFASLQSRAFSGGL